MTGMKPKSGEINPYVNYCENKALKEKYAQFSDKSRGKNKVRQDSILS